MSIEASQETHGFQTEVKQLMRLMIHSLYSNKEIFLRELISNASDAADKLRFKALEDDSLYEGDAELKIRVEFDKTLKTITIIDNGIGMSRNEVIENLGTIAKSGTRQFFESLTGDTAKDSQLIGQFGVGFYSCFIIARKVEVVTRRVDLPRTEGVRWTSDGENGYTVETFDRPRRGTKVILHLREGMDEFLDGYRLRGIIGKYSDHISLPIVMDKEERVDGDSDKKVESSAGEETVNKATALWTRHKKDITPEEYNEFYKHVSHDFKEPLAWIHNRVEGKLEYTALLYIPASAPFDLWDHKGPRHGVKLYVRRVFIMDDAEALIPPWLRFVRGVVDSDDLPLNVSRELLQRNKAINQIRSACTKKILGLLKNMAEKETEKYGEFWKVFGKVLKEGSVDGHDYKDDLSALFCFASTHEDSEEQKVSIQDYTGRMQEGQKAIYYVTAESWAAARHSPHLEIFNKKGIEVLLLTDPIDEWVVTYLGEIDGKPLQSVSKGELDLGDVQDDKDKEEDKQKNKDFDKLVKRIKKALGEKVKTVRITSRLTASPACLVNDEHDMGRHLEKILKASGQHIPGTKPILEINPGHPVVKKISEETNEDLFTDWSHILFDQALLSEGGQLEDAAGFVRKLNKLVMILTESKEV